MYADLLERRSNMSKNASEADEETMARVAEEQMEIGIANKGKKL